MLRRSPDWADLARTSRWFGLGIVLAIVASVLLTGQWGAGYVQRLLLTLGAVWVGLLARRAVQLTRPSRQEATQSTTDASASAATQAS